MKTRYLRSSIIWTILCWQNLNSFFLYYEKNLLQMLHKILILFDLATYTSSQDIQTRKFSSQHEKLVFVFTLRVDEKKVDEVVYSCMHVYIILDLQIVLTNFHWLYCICFNNIFTNWVHNYTKLSWHISAWCHNNKNDLPGVAFQFSQQKIYVQVFDNTW